jgi:hypothetical protein
MKYTKYIINGNFVDIEQLIENKYLRFITVPIAVLVAFTGLIFLSGALPLTITVDMGRSLKYEYHKLLRKHYTRKYYENMFASLSLEAIRKFIVYSKAYIV